MTVIFIVCFMLTIGYAVLMLLYRHGWLRQRTTRVPHDYVTNTSISVIIPARNEADNIATCIQSALAQDYPSHLLQVIVVDDHSEDDTTAIVKGFADSRVKYIDLSNHLQDNEKTVAYKKKALSVGIAESKGELIVTTDADCFAGTQWLKHIAYVYEQEQAVMVVAPVDFTTDGSMVQVFQSLDFMSMQGITAASHKLRMGNMSNGANLAFSREAFTAVGGYAGVDHLASGDDYLLMMKLQKQYNDRISYLKSKDAIVHTAPQPDWSNFLQQRIRWASKSGKYDDKKMTAVLSFVYLFNVSFLVVLIEAFSRTDMLWLLAHMLLVKIIVELIYLCPVAGFFSKRRQLFMFPLLQPLHIIYIITAGLLGFAGVYRWKGRKVK